MFSLINGLCKSCITVESTERMQNVKVETVNNEIPQNTTTIKSKPIDENQLFLNATNEVEDESLKDIALWSKCMALSDGDNNKAKYMYIRERVDNLKQENINSTELNNNITVEDENVPSTVINEDIKETKTEQPVDPITTNHHYSNVNNDDSFFKKFTNGDFGLAKTYWGFGFLVSIIFRTVFEAVEDREVLIIGILIHFFYTICLIKGIWLASDKYEGPKIWAILAKLSCIGGMISAFALLLLLMNL